jgi:hypothetical protein
MRAAVMLALETLHAVKEAEETADDHFKVTEGNALSIISSLPGLFKYEESLESANANSASTERRSTLEVKISGPLSEMDYNFGGMSNINNEVTSQAALQYLDDNKLAIILWRAYLSINSNYHLNVRDSYIGFSVYVNTHLENSQTEYENSMFSKLYSILNDLNTAFNTEVTQEMIGHGRRRFAGIRENIVDRIEYQSRNDAEEANKQKTTKFAEILGGGEFIEAGLIELQLIEMYKLLPANGLVARTWGFEVEVPDAKGVDAPAGIEKGEDGSLRSYESSSDCECDCESCTYHDCDCDMCDNRSDGDDHCGNSNCATADCAEYRTTGGVQRIVSSGLYTLCKDLDDVDAEINDTAGTHIHVYAKDLTTNQVGQVLASYKRLEPIMEVISGRADVNYARNIPIEYIRAALKKRGATIFTDKPRAVTTTHLTNNRGTIEFRQMDCNLNADRITLWAWICRAFVTAAKRGMTVRDVLPVTDLVSLVEVFAKFNVLLHDENPELIVYGSKTDAGNFTQVTHQVA